MERKIDRFDKYMKLSGLNDNRVTVQLGISVGTIGKSRKEGRDLSSDAIEKILKFYTDINDVWLLTGKGEMLKSLSNAKSITEFEFLQVPFIPIHAQAGYSRGYGDLEYIETLPKIPVITDKSFKGKYRVFEVSGDSMDNGMRDSFADKDIILCREVMPEYWKSKLHIRDWYFVIVCKNDGIFVKQITDHNVEDGLITCHSLNQMYEDFVIDLRDVAELYNVIKLVDRSARI